MIFTTLHYLYTSFVIYLYTVSGAAEVSGHSTDYPGSSRGGSVRGGAGSSRGGSARGGAGSSWGRSVHGSVYGYTDMRPVLDGDMRCPHCLCTPCVIVMKPSFLVGSSVAHDRNAHKRFPLYKKFWRVLNDLGVWRHELYLQRKVLRTSLHDVREIMPDCVLQVRTYIVVVSTIITHMYY